MTGKIHRALSRAVHRMIEIFLEARLRQKLHPQTRLLEIARDEACSYITAKMPRALTFPNWKELHLYCLKQATVAGLYLEFGVAYATSTNWLAEHGGRTVHGFDSFEGLPEDWNGRHESKGAYSLGGKMPSVLKNVRLYKGWFDQTLPEFLRQNREPVALVHVDCDLFSSTEYLLEQLRPRLQVGTVIIFDEYFNYISWREHEFKAFHEFVKKYEVKYEYIAWSYQQAAVKIFGGSF